MLYERRAIMRRTLFLIVLVLMAAALLPAQADTEIFEAPKQIVVTFTGDCTLGSDPAVRGQKNSFEAYIDQYGYEYPFEKVRQYFEQDDLTVINLEGTFYDIEANRAEKTYTFRGPTDYINILTSSSVEACSVGNNHILDYGKAGMESTLAALDGAGIGWFGTTEYCNGAYVYEKDGAKIGFVSIYISDWWTPGMPTLIQQHMTDLRANGCGLIVACMHGGVEYDTRHEMNQEKMADKLIASGADVVVGNHPHSIQGIREQDGACTLWSLGNFSFGGNTKVVVSRKKSPNYGKINLNTYIAQFTFSFDENNRYLGHQLNIIPCYVSGSGTEDNNYQPVPVTGKDAEKVLKAIQDDTPYRRLTLNPYVEGVGAVQDFVPGPVR